MVYFLVSEPIRLVPTPFDLPLESYVLPLQKSDDIAHARALASYW